MAEKTPHILGVSFFACTKLFHGIDMGGRIVIIACNI